MSLYDKMLFLGNMEDIEGLLHEVDALRAELAKYRGMEVELAAAKNDLERYTRPLTAEQAHSVMSAVVQRLGGSTCRRDADAFDAAIREVRSK